MQKHPTPNPKRTRGRNSAVLGNPQQGLLKTKGGPPLHEQGFFGFHPQQGIAGRSPCIATTVHPMSKTQFKSRNFGLLDTTTGPKIAFGHLRTRWSSVFIGIPSRNGAQTVDAVQHGGRFFAITYAATARDIRQQRVGNIQTAQSQSINKNLGATNLQLPSFHQAGAVYFQSNIIGLALELHPSQTPQIGQQFTNLQIQHHLANPAEFNS